MAKKIIVFAGSVREFRYYVNKMCIEAGVGSNRFLYGNSPSGDNLVGQEIEYLVYFGNWAHNTTVEMITRVVYRIYGPIRVVHHNRMYRYEIMQRLDKKFIMDGYNFTKLSPIDYNKLYFCKWGNDSTWIMDHPCGESYQLK